VGVVMATTIRRTVAWYQSLLIQVSVLPGTRIDRRAILVA
jgi:hypothetical protein